MTFTDPRDWTTGEVVTASIMDVHVRDNLKAILHPYDYSSSDVDVVSTTTETSIYSKVITGGDLGANGLAVVRMYADVLYNNSSTDDLIIKVKWGGSTQINASGWIDEATPSASRQPARIEIILANKGATNSQLLYMHGWNLDRGSRRSTAEYIATSAIDSTSDQTLQVTAQWSASSANLSFRKRLAVLHLGQN